MAVVAGTCSEVVTALNCPDTVSARIPGRPPRIAFIFTAEGDHWYTMGRELLETYPDFAGAIYYAGELLEPLHPGGLDLYAELTRDEGDGGIDQADISQVVCTAVQLALTDLLERFLIRPIAITGHSGGRIAAAYAAGSLGFEGAMVAAYLKDHHLDGTGTMGAYDDHIVYHSPPLFRDGQHPDFGHEEWRQDRIEPGSFEGALRHLCVMHQPDVLIELGLHSSTLNDTITQTLATLCIGGDIAYLPTLVRGQDAMRTVLQTAASLFVRGVELDFNELNHNRAERERPEPIGGLLMERHGNG
jgi:acyl transferase domain-containing protein